MSCHFNDMLRKELQAQSLISPPYHTYADGTHDEIESPELEVKRIKVHANEISKDMELCRNILT